MDIKYMSQKLIAGFFILLIYIKISGRKQLSPISPTDQIGNMVMGALISSAIFSYNVTILESVMIVSIWAMLQLLLRHIKFKSSYVTELLDGKKYQLMKDGKIIEEEFKNAQISLLDFENNIHNQDVKSISEINNAWFDSSGNITLDLKSEKEQSNVLIYNGNINHGSLERLGIEEENLEKLLLDNHIENISEILCLEYFNENFYLYSNKGNKKLNKDKGRDYEISK